MRRFILISIVPLLAICMGFALTTGEAPTAAEHAEALLQKQLST